MKLKLTLFALSFFLILGVKNSFAQKAPLPPLPANMIIGVSVHDLHKAPMAVNLPRWKTLKKLLTNNSDGSNLLDLVYGKTKVDPYTDEEGEEAITKTPVYLTELPTETGSTVIYHLFTIVRYDGNSSFTSDYDNNDLESHRFVKVIKFDLIVSNSSEEGAISNQKEFYLTYFNAEVSLVERKLILTDIRNKLKIVMPIGVGSFDLGVMNPHENSLMTPRFNKAFLKKASTLSRRNHPKVYDGKPFIRVVDGISGEDTEVGFHRDVNGAFVRGFDSHGCMRLRLLDLYLLHDLVRNVQVQMQLKIKYQIADGADHPAAKRNQVYKQVKNIGTVEEPLVSVGNIDLLTALETVKGVPPTEKLLDADDDHYYNKFHYTGLESFEKQQGKIEKMCREQSKFAPNPDKATQECMKPYQIDNSIGTSWDRWWSN